VPRSPSCSRKPSRKQTEVPSSSVADTGSVARSLVFIESCRAEATCARALGTFESCAQDRYGHAVHSKEAACEPWACSAFSEQPLNARLTGF